MLFVITLILIAIVAPALLILAARVLAAGILALLALCGVGLAIWLMPQHWQEIASWAVLAVVFGRPAYLILITQLEKVKS